jgi:hypothetical protein
LLDEDVLIFLDADGSDHPELMSRLLEPLMEGADLVISNRFTSHLHPQAMTLPQVLGNKLAVFLVRLLWGYAYRDLGPFRAITRPALERLSMSDTTFGWTIEMQVKALTVGLSIVQVDMPYRMRAGGQSKISGTACGVLRAGWKILSTILMYRLVSPIGARESQKPGRSRR